MEAANIMTTRIPARDLRVGMLLVMYQIAEQPAQISSIAEITHTATKADVTLDDGRFFSFKADKLITVQVEEYDF